MKANYNKLMNALNLIDEQAEQGGTDIAESKARAKAYNLVADYIETSLTWKDIDNELKRRGTTLAKLIKASGRINK